MDQTTSLSLLDRVGSNADHEAWERLVAIYRPLLERWLGSYEVQAADAEDLIQEVLTIVLQDVGSFDHNRRTGAFRAWLRRILANRVRNFWRTRNYSPRATGTSSLLERIKQLEDDSSGLSRIWNTDHDQHVMAQLVQAVRPRVQPQTWEAFRRQVFEGQRADVVAEDLGMSLSAVYVARSRVLATLRREAAGLVETI